MAPVDAQPNPGQGAPLLDVLWRRRWIILAVALLGTASAAVISKSLSPVWSATSRLLVVQSTDTQSFDAVQAAQVTARTYADVLDSVNIAADVARRLGVDVQDVRESTSFEPLPETQLLAITSEQPTAEQARDMSNAYAEVFTAYARERLQPTTQATVSIADRAALPRAAARPKPTLYTLVAGLLSLGLGVALALLRDRLDTRLPGSDALESDFGLTTLARVPVRGSSRESVTAFAEAFRILRVGVQFADPDDPPRSVIVTSASEGEGKTTVARNLALAAAEAGQSVIAVEADVYRPALREALGAASDTRPPGVVDHLIGRASIDQCLIDLGVGNLRLLPAGTSALSLASLLQSSRGRRLVAELSDRADLVILDCPPFAPRADTIALATQADGVLLVLDGTRTRRRAVREIVRGLATVNARVLGVALNRTQSADSYSSYLADEEPTAAGASR